MCACILHNLLIEYPVPQDLIDWNDLELDKEDELNHPAISSNEDKRQSQIFAYLLEIC